VLEDRRHRGARRKSTGILEKAIEPLATNTAYHPNEVGADRARIGLGELFSLPDVAGDATVSAGADQLGAPEWAEGRVRRGRRGWLLGVGALAISFRQGANQ